MTRSTNLSHSQPSAYAQALKQAERQQELAKTVVAEHVAESTVGQHQNPTTPDLGTLEQNVSKKQPNGLMRANHSGLCPLRSQRPGQPQPSAGGSMKRKRGDNQLEPHSKGKMRAVNGRQNLVRHAQVHTDTNESNPNDRFLQDIEEISWPEDGMSFENSLRATRASSTHLPHGANIPSRSALNTKQASVVTNESRSVNSEQEIWAAMNDTVDLEYESLKLQKFSDDECEAILQTPELLEMLTMKASISGILELLPNETRERVLDCAYEPPKVERLSNDLYWAARQVLVGPPKSASLMETAARYLHASSKRRELEYQSLKAQNLTPAECEATIKTPDLSQLLTEEYPIKTIMKLLPGITRQKVLEGAYDPQKVKILRNALNREVEPKTPTNVHDSMNRVEIIFPPASPYKF